MTGMRGLCCPACGHTLHQRGAYVQGVTRRQGDVLNIYATRALRGEPTPSYTEIMAVLGFKARSQVAEKVHALIGKGMLAFADGDTRRYRNVIVTERAWRLYAGSGPEAAHGA